MNTAELKIDLINRITNTDDPGIIYGLQRVLDFELEKETYQLSPEQECRINEAKAEYSAGRVLSEQEANETIEQWLKEK